jgi:4-hydroxy-4-methyl-2-oxoglutarate aldolase
VESEVITMIRITRLAAAVCAAAVLAPTIARAQLFKLTKEELIAYTAQSPFERFPDGRPKVPDAMLERARALSMEEIWGALRAKGYRNQFEGGLHVLHPGKTMVGRAFTVQFMPLRPDIAGVLDAKRKPSEEGHSRGQVAMDMLQPGDVFVVDLFGKGEGGTVVGDNLFYYIKSATKGGGLVVDGAIRDLKGISEIDMPAYFRHTHPSALDNNNVMITGINIPVRIGDATVMPGDLVVGDEEGVSFIPTELVTQILDTADVTHIHDEWTKKKFDEGKYVSSDVYGSPRDPALKKEYDDFLKKRLAEIRKK